MLRINPSAPWADAQRYQQLERVIHVAELLLPLRLGAYIPQIWRDVRETFPVCERTIRRDLFFLERLALVELEPCGRWRWVANELVSELWQQMAMVTSATRDAIEEPQPGPVSWVGAEVLAEVA
ncbi:MAG: hypothetical protein AAF802_07660 [Planctomycetota bacterium]